MTTPLSEKDEGKVSFFYYKKLIVKILIQIFSSLASRALSLYSTVYRQTDPYQINSGL